MRTVFAVSLLAFSLAVTGCKKHGPTAAHSTLPGTDEGARALLAEFLKPGADIPALSKSLRPDPEDYAAVFTGDAAKKVQGAIDPAWDAGHVTVKAVKPSQTELLFLSATVDELKAGSPNCPVGYKDAAAQMKAGLTVHCFKFVEPGTKTGSAYDGLIFVNGHWALFPKPWTALK